MSYIETVITRLREFLLTHDEQFKDDPLHVNCRIRIEKAIKDLGG